MFLKYNKTFYRHKHCYSAYLSLLYRRYPRYIGPSFINTFGNGLKSMSTRAAAQHYKLIFRCPTGDINKVKDAVFETGAGTYPGNKYARVSFDIQGRGQFTPIGDANPAIGTVGKAEQVDETRCEIFCGSKDIARNAVKALIKAHPYEQVGYEVYEMVDILADDNMVD